MCCCCNYQDKKSMSAYSVAVERVILTGTLKYAASYQCHVWPLEAAHGPGANSMVRPFFNGTLSGFICMAQSTKRTQTIWYSLPLVWFMICQRCIQTWWIGVDSADQSNCTAL